MQIIERSTTDYSRFMNVSLLAIMPFFWANKYSNMKKIVDNFLSQNKFPGLISFKQLVSNAINITLQQILSNYKA